MIETWKRIISDEIKDIYEISSFGRIRNITTHEFLHGCNPNHNKGYLRVTLQLKSNGHKKFNVHRLVCEAFRIKKIGKDEVNHKDGDKLNNRLDNIEWMNTEENKRHASENRLYKSCEDSHKSIFTNKQVEEICYLFSKGYSVPAIIDKLHLYNIKNILQYMSRIKNRKTWVNISKNYEWDNDKIRYKTYEKEDIEKICYLISKKYESSEIEKLFDNKYNNRNLHSMIRNVRKGELYKDIFYKYNGKSSTTIENSDEREIRHIRVSRVDL